MHFQFVLNLEELVTPLNALLKSGELAKRNHFGNAEASAFMALINGVTYPPLFALPILDLPIEMDTDASVTTLLSRYFK